MSNPVPLAYNPREESWERLEEMLVGRDDILHELQDDLRLQAKSATRQHWLIRGPRGMGKTHLIAILYHRIHRNSELSAAFLPVWLGESEAYEAYSAGMLLLAVASRLAAELDQHGNGPAAACVSKAISEITYGGDDPALFDDVCQLLKREAQRSGKILVVLMENLDAWLESISGQRGTMEAGRLRSLLSDDKEFLFISTTPTRYLPKLSRPGSPLFGHLRERRLRPMSEENLRDLFGKLKTLTGRTVDVEDDPGRPESRLRWRVLHRLAGGNPRAAVMGFSVMSGEPGIRAMVEELRQLLDAQTAYFEARLARLAPRERAIVKAVALSHKNLTISEIAELTRLPERSLSTQVKRLLDEGHIAPAGGRVGKGSVFELTDGLFRTWLHYRSGRRMLEPLVRFLAIWHTPSELESTLAALSAEMTAARLAIEHDLLETTTVQIRSALDYARSPIGSAEREQLWMECEKEMAIAGPVAESLVETPKLEEGEESIEALRATISRFESSQEPADQERVARAMVRLGIALWESKSREEALGVYRDLTARFGSSDEVAVQKHVAHAGVNLGAILGKSGQFEQSLAASREVIVSFGNSVEPNMQEYVATATFHVGTSLSRSGHVEEAVAAWHDVVTRLSGSTEPATQQVATHAMICILAAAAQLGRIDKELAVYHDLIARFGNSVSQGTQRNVAGATAAPAAWLGRAGRIEVSNQGFALFSRSEPAVQEQIALSLANIGIALQQAGRVEEALTTWGLLVALFCDSTEPAVQTQVAQGMVNLGAALGESGKLQEAIAICREVIARFGNSAFAPVRVGVAAAMSNLALALGQSGHAEEEMAAYRDLIEHFGEDGEPALSRNVALGMLNLAVSLRQSGRTADEIATHRDLIARFGSSSDTETREFVARALVNLGAALVKAGRIGEALAAYRETIARFGESTEPSLQGQVAAVMVNLGVTLGRSGNADEEIATYRGLILRLGDSETSAVQLNVANAAFNLAFRLSECERVEESLAAYRDLIARFGGSAMPAVRTHVVNAAINLSIALRQCGQLDEALATCRELISRFGSNLEIAQQGQVASSMVHLSGMLGRSGRVKEALETSREAIARFGDSEDPSLRKSVTGAMVNMATALGVSGHIDEEMSIYTGIMDRLGDSSYPALDESAVCWIVNLGFRLDQSGRANEAAAVYRDVIGRFAESGQAEVRRQVGFAMLYLGNSYQTEQASQAAELLRGAITRFDSTDPAVVWAHLFLTRSLRRLGRHDEAQSEVFDAGHRLAESHGASLAVAEQVLQTVLSSLPLAGSERLVGEIEGKAEPSIVEMAQMYRFVLDLLRADEPAEERATPGPQARRKRVLERVPEGLRETVIEKADRIREERSKSSAAPEV